MPISVMYAKKYLIEEVIMDDKKIKVWGYEESENKLNEYLTSDSKGDLDLSKWLPAIKRIRKHGVRTGEVIVIMAATKLGKTIFLQNLLWQMEEPFLLFETELPSNLTMFRFLQIALKRTDDQLEQDYQDGQPVPELIAGKFKKNVHCVYDYIDVDDVIPIVKEWETVNKRKLKILAFDHLGLIKGKGNSKYERTSYVVDRLKDIAKQTDTVVIIISQIHRPPDVKLFDYRPQLNSAKDSGNIENAADLALGLYYPKDQEKVNQKSNLHIEILANRDGIWIDEVIECYFFKDHGKETLRIIPIEKYNKELFGENLL